MKTRIGLVILLAVSVLSACSVLPGGLSPVRGSGRVVSEEREVSGFSGVMLGTIGEMTITLGDRDSLRIEADDNVLPYLESRVQGGELKIESKPRTNFSLPLKVHYYVTVKKLDSIYVGSVGSITVESPDLDATRFSITVASVGRVNLAGLRAETLNVDISSVGDVEIMTGEVTAQKIDISSVGSYKAGNLRSKSATVDVSSVGNVTLWVDETLDVKITSVGSVQYYGRPRVTSNVTSVGKLVSLGEK